MARKIQITKRGARAGVRFVREKQSQRNKVIMPKATTRTKRSSSSLSLCEIKDYNAWKRSQEPLVPKPMFRELVREMAKLSSEKGNIRFDANAMRFLQQAAEAFMAHVSEMSNLEAARAGRITFQSNDMRLALRYLDIAMGSLQGGEESEGDVSR